ncbi:uncharacterized protein LOC122655979 isoform X1 [Telopea speciosissima]|uniref:uncharacterized protein LOC122655979 isoform X1 n=1 Tax=Telopea speciosissima TaxID=54955 RepID=UPI001CC39DFD|nr:uncharacterized protein LOC122655979 isoform X1 [Telopea speciosissima]
MESLNLKMKKCFSSLTNSQLQPCQQEEEPRLGMFNFSSFDSFEVRKAWDLVQTRTTGADAMATRNKYIEAVKKVEEQARKIYRDDTRAPVPSGDDFVAKMIDQGCFVLQVALLSLGGASEKLNQNWNKALVEGWVPSLFRISSQLPLVILKKLMKQSFFQEVLKSRKQWNRPKDMARMILYEQLVEPMLEGSGQKVDFMNQFVNGLINKSMGFSDQEPPTLLHALWLHQTGPGAIIGCNVGDEDEDESSNSWNTVRSATELQMVGITFKSNQGKFSRGIKFKEKMIDAVICFPPITIDSNTKTLFDYLIDYEVDIELGKTQREVCSYLKLMGELVRTPNDAKVLAMQGIVNADPEGEEGVPVMLQSLISRLPDEVGDNQHMIDVRGKIRSYVKPSNWGKVMNLIVITVFLTFLQTFYAMLSYHYPKK